MYISTIDQKKNFVAIKIYIYTNCLNGLNNINKLICSPVYSADFSIKFTMFEDLALIQTSTTSCGISELG